MTEINKIAYKQQKHFLLMNNQVNGKNLALFLFMKYEVDSNE